MKFWSIFTLAVFLNFMALPSLSLFFEWDIQIDNVVLSEEETQHAPLELSEKTTPNILNVHDFMGFSSNEHISKDFTPTDDFRRLSPYLGIFSPPPQI